MKYEIDPLTFAVNIFDGKNPEPFWYQPDYPNGDKFDSFDEAEAWAKLAVKSHDPEYGFYAPNGKGLPGESKPTEQELTIKKLERVGLSVDDLKSLLGL